MLAKLKLMQEIFKDSSLDKLVKNGHYWKFYYKDKPTLGFRNFYLKYFNYKSNRIVTIKPKKDRKKNIIPGKFEVYGKRGNYVFTAYQCWFEWIDSTPVEAEPKIIPKVIKVPSMKYLPWDMLFEV